MDDIAFPCHPDDIARHYGFNARLVRQRVREHGLGYKCGRVTSLEREDAEELMAILKAKPTRRSYAATPLSQSGIRVGRTQKEAGEEALRRARMPKRK